MPLLRLSLLRLPVSRPSARRPGPALPSLVMALLATLTLGAPARAEIIRVPQDEPTVQQGLWAAGPGDTVLIKAGTYVENLVLADREDITVRGKGQVILRRAEGSPGSPTLSVEKSRDIRIEGLSFRDDPEGTGLRILSSTAVSVRRCRFEDLSTGLRIDDCVGVLVRENRIADVFTGIDLGDGRRHVVQDNSVQRTQAYGIVLSGADQCWIRDNQLRDQGGRGIYTTGGAFQVHITDNDLRGADEAILVTGSHHRVSGNRIGEARVGITLGYPGNGTSLLAQGNRIWNTEGVGILVHASESQVLDNTVRKTGSDGIRIDTTQVLVAGNSIAGAGERGLALDASLIAALDNRIRKSQGEDLASNSSSNLLVDNDVPGAP